MKTVNVRRVVEEIEELTTKFLSIPDPNSAEAQKIARLIKRKIKQLEEAGI